MTIPYSRATRWAQAIVVLVLMAGATLLVREARESSRAPADHDFITNTKTSSETKATAKGPESSERRETSTAPNPNLTERILGRSGLWVVRGILLLTGAFLAGAVAQRALLGKFAFKAGGLEVPEVQAPALIALPASIAQEFQRVITSDEWTKTLETPTEISDSDTPSALRQLRDAGPIDYTEIDLGEGNNWLTTRLFVLAVLLRRMRAVKTLVFLENRSGLDRRYLGVRSPDAVRWVLACHYPWLEQAFAQAYARIPELKILSEWGALPAESIEHLVQQFIQDPAIQGYQPADDRENWVKMSSNVWEHARWLNGTIATDLFNLSPLTTSCVDLGSDKTEENLFAELSAEGRFVALVDSRRRFLKLVDREGLLENLAAEVRLKYAIALAFGQAEGGKPSSSSAAAAAAESKNNVLH